MKTKLFLWLTGLLIIGVTIIASFSAPTVIRSDVELDQSKVTFNAPFTIHFDQIMQRSSVEGAFQVLPKAEGEFKWKDSRTLEFHPSTRLTIGDEYKIIISKEAKSIWRKKMGFDETFNYIVTGPPYVLFNHPAEGAMLTKNETITVMFDRPMDWEAINQKELIQIEPPVKGNVRFMGMSAFQFIPNKSLSDEIHVITISANLPALDGGMTEEEFSWSVISPSLKVLKSKPPHETEETEVFKLDQAITIHFNQEINLEGIKPGVNALLYPSNDLNADTERREDGFFNTEVTYGLSESGDIQRDTLVFEPTFPYQNGGNYRFVLKADEDLPLGEDFELHFETIDVVEVVEEPVPEKLLDPIKLEKPSMAFFVQGESPQFQIQELIKQPSLLSVCQIPSNQFIRLSAKRDWTSFVCENDPVLLDPTKEKLTTILDLDKYFDLDWATGVYFTSLKQGENTITKQFMVEDTSLLMKRSDSDLLIWALEIESGKPIPGMEVEVINYNGEKITMGKTDEFGVFTLNQNIDEGTYVRVKKEEGDELKRWGLVSDQWFLEDQGASLYSEYSNLNIFLNQYVFSPSEELHFKGVWRVAKDNALELPDVTTYLTIGLEDTQHNLIDSRRIPLRQNGSFDGSIILPENSLPGDYWLTVSDINHQILTDPIAIQIKNQVADLELEWVQLKENHVANTVPLYVAKARYKNGIPAANIKGKFELYKKPSFYKYQNGAVSYSFEKVGEKCNANCDQQTLVNSGDLEFDEEGEVSLTLSEGEDGFLDSGYEYELWIEGFLLNGPSSKIHHSFTVHQGHSNIGLGLKHSIIESNKENIEASLLNLNQDGVFEADLKVILSLLSQNGKERFYQKELNTNDEPLSVPIPVDENMENGVYLLRAEGQDSESNEIMAEQLVFIATNQDEALDSNLLLALDQKKYFVGGRAHLLISEPSASELNPVPVLLSHEGQGLLKHEVLNLTSPLTKVAIPIKSSMMPHFLVKVTRFNEGISPSFTSAQQIVEVGNDETEIFVELALEDLGSKEGEENKAKLTIQTSDYQNRAISSVLAVNVLNQESALRQFSYESFYPTLPTSLRMTSNLNIYVPENFAASAKSFIPTFKILSEGRSVYFNPLVTTDENGRAELELNLPKNKDSLFVQVIATKGVNKFGTGFLNLKTDQELLIKPVLPSFVVPGDQTIFAASVRNVSDEALESQLTLTSPDIAIQGDAARHFFLEPGEQTEINFKVFINEALDQEAISLSFESKNNLLEPQVPLKHLKDSIKIRGGLLENIWTGRISFKESSYPKLGSLQLAMSAYPLNTSAIQSRALEDFEQSSTYLVTAKLLARIMLLKENASSKSLFSVSNLTASLLKHADEKGAYRFWNEPDPSPSLSALALLAYTRAIDAGIEIDAIQINRTIEYLWQSVEGGNVSMDEKAFILWVLSENEQYDTEKTLNLFQERGSLSLKAKAFLLLNANELFQAGQNSLSGMLDTLKTELMNAVIQEKDFAYFDTDSSVETTAIVLFALSELDADNPILKSMVNYLTSQKDNLINGLNIKEALWKVMSLQTFSEKSGAIRVNHTIQISLNGNALLKQAITNEEAKRVFKKIVDAETLKEEGLNDIFTRKSGNGPVYLDGYLTTYLDPRKVSRVEEGILLIRTFYELTDDGEKVAVSSFKRGGHYVSELELVVPQDYAYVMLWDEIPAGLRASIGEGNFDEHFVRQELKNGRATYYAPFLPAGVYKINTSIEAILPGEYLLLPANVQLMFDSKVVSRTGGGVVSVTE